MLYIYMCSQHYIFGDGVLFGFWHQLEDVRSEYVKYLEEVRQMNRDRERERLELEARLKSEEQVGRNGCVNYNYLRSHRISFHCFVGAVRSASGR
jgi:hypothetical protein